MSQGNGYLTVYSISSISPTHDQWFELPSRSTYCLPLTEFGSEAEVSKLKIYYNFEDDIEQLRETHKAFDLQMFHQYTDHSIADSLFCVSKHVADVKSIDMDGEVAEFLRQFRRAIERRLFPLPSQCLHCKDSANGS